jgi:hypothetical protein
MRSDYSLFAGPFTVAPQLLLDSVDRDQEVRLYHSGRPADVAIADATERKGARIGTVVQCRALRPRRRKLARLPIVVESSVHVTLARGRA